MKQLAAIYHSSRALLVHPTPIINGSRDRSIKRLSLLKLLSLACFLFPLLISPPLFSSPLLSSPVSTHSWTSVELFCAIHDNPFIFPFSHCCRTKGISIMSCLIFNSSAPSTVCWDGFFTFFPESFTKHSGASVQPEEAQNTARPTGTVNSDEIFIRLGSLKTGSLN